MGVASLVEGTQVRLPFYDRLFATFVRDFDGALLTCSGPRSANLQQCWPDYVRHGVFDRSTSGQVDSGRVRGALPRTGALEDTTVLECIERQIQGDCIVGVVVRTPSERRSSDDFFASLVLDSLESVYNMNAKAHRNAYTDVDSAAQQITDLFDRTLRHVAKYDQWHSSGRDHFLRKVEHFVSSGLPIELCLPAFPCKSSNLDKVSDTLPDRGERIALETLHTFVRAVENIHAPGALIWIISDGHVFSDCIGVDDHVVDSYNEALQAMNDAVASISRTRNRVRFRSLVQLLQLRPSSHSRLIMEPATTTVKPFFAIEIDEQAELSRRILLHGFRPDASLLRDQITACDATALATYRGFSRFMLEDLENNPYAAGRSRTQLRKLSSKIAIEMIERNQAYSNLIETLLPHHVRLSIHAHNNAGPKFGIDLFGGRVRVVKSLISLDAPDGVPDRLHIPTPWHGCIVELQGHSQLYMTKAHAVRAAIDGGMFEGSLTAENSTDGALYLLRDIRTPRPTSCSASGTAVTSTTSLCEEKSRAAVQTDEIFSSECELPPLNTRSRNPITQQGRFLRLECRSLFGMCFGVV